MYYLKGEVDRLLNAALDQPAPTRELADALNAMLSRSRHADRLRDRDQNGVIVIIPLKTVPPL